MTKPPSTTAPRSGRWRAALLLASAAAALGVLSAGCAASGATARSAAGSLPTGGSGTTVSTGPALRTLPVKGGAPRTGYSRGELGPAWTDSKDPWGRDRCGTCGSIVARALEHMVGKGGCTVLSGVLHDVDTGMTSGFVREAATSSAVQSGLAFPGEGAQ